MRWIVRIGILCLILVALALAALIFVPGERIARIAEQRFESATGRAMTLSDDVRTTIWPRLGVTVGRIEVANADWSGAGPMLSADSARVGVDLWALISGAIRIEEVAVINPVLRLETAADGRTNWNLGAADTADTGAPEATAPRDTLRAFTINSGILRGGRIIHTDGATGRQAEISDLDLKLSLLAFDGPADMALSARVNGQPVEARARIAEFDLFVAGDVTGLDLSVSSGANTLALNGRGGHGPVALEGRFEATLDDPPALFRALGQSAPDIPAGFGRNNAALSGDLTVMPEKVVHLRDGAIRLDGNALTGGFDIDLSGDRPRVNARFSGGALDFSSLASGGGGDAASGNEPGWPNQPIDTAPLALADGQVGLVADSIDLGLLKLGEADVTATLDSARLVFDLRRIGAYEGIVSGELVVNGRDGLSVGGDLRADDMALQPMLRDFAGYERLSGTGAVSLQILGVGNDVNTIMHSLSGGGSMDLGKGALQGIDLLGILRNPQGAGGGTTIYDAVTATFTIDGGVLSNDDLTLDAPLISATGAGRVDIGNQSLDYRVIPTALAGEDGGGISVPVIITGPWAAPSVRPDLEFLLEQELAGERRAVEERLKQEAEEALGVTRQEGESVEDAVKRKVEEEIGNKLLDIFGNN